MICTSIKRGTRIRFLSGSLAGVLLLMGSAAPARDQAFCGAVGPAVQPDHSAVVPPSDADLPGAGLVELFPAIRVDRKARVVEVDGVVPIDVHQVDRKTGARLHVFLEVVLCPFDTKEHEALVATKARPSNIHAALLLLGLEPGKPGSWSFDEKTRTLKEIPPEGPELGVTLVWTDEQGESVEMPAAQLVERVPGGGTLETGGRETGWVFAGSTERERLGQTHYAADAEGTAVGLTTFGTETVAWRSVYSPEDAVSRPQWAASAKLPARNTKVMVRITAQ